MLRLVDRTWPWLPIALAALALLIALVSLATAPGPTDPEQVTDVVEDVSVAVADGDGDRACDLLTARFAREVGRRIEGVDCAAHVRSFGIGVPGRQLRDAPRQPPVVAGDRASVLQETIGVRVELRRTADGWRVDRLARVRARAAR